jgi:peptidoglycan/LPS O-acetylase OafA/YrhL
MKLLNGLRRVTSTGAYDPRIDGLRFLAILPVLIYHASLRGERISPHPLSGTEQWWLDLVPRGWGGVMLFFFISGYILAFPFFRASAQGKPFPGVAAFYKRRAMRLMPAYVIALTGAFLALQMSGYAPADAPKFNALSIPLPLSYAVSLLYQHNMVFGAGSRVLPPIWTLEIEIQFYIFAPFLLAWYAKADVARRRLWIAAAIVLSIFANDWIPLSQYAQPRLSISVLGYLHYFLAGILAGDVMFGRQPQARPWGDPLFVAGYLALLYCSTYGRETTPQLFARDGGMFLGVIATYFGAMYGNRSTGFLSLRAVAITGGACYSIYLTHLPIIQAWSEVVKRLSPAHSLWHAWLLMVPSIPVAVAVGMVFYALVERPTMKPDWPQRLGQALAGRKRALAE